MNEADDRRVKALEDRIEAMAPIVAFFNAGTMLGKILVILGGVAVGAATIWGAIASLVQGHWK